MLGPLALALHEAGDNTAARREVLRALEEAPNYDKAQALLLELNARGKADELRGLISRDAIARLRQVDESLTRSELYSVRGRDFRGWVGDKGPLLQAFGVSLDEQVR